MNLNWRVAFLAGLMGLTVGLRGEEVVERLDWRRLAEPGATNQVELVTRGNGETWLRVVHTNAEPIRVRLGKVERPAVSGGVYAIRGQVSYKGVQGDGYLEMWSVLRASETSESEGRYFSRTLGSSGPMEKLSGSSDGRIFVLPFIRNGMTAPPARLELNLVLPGAGTVEIGPLELVDHYEFGAAGPNDWWSERTAGMLGGFGGAFIGCFASLVAWLAAKRKARGFVLGATQVLIGLGGLLALGFAAALALRQPYAVWFPLGLFALLLLTILPFRLRDFRRFYADGEMRKMTAADALNR